VFEAAYAVGRNLAKLTQAEIAKELGITQGRLSQLFTSVEGGWRRLQKLLISLIEKHKEKLIFSEGDGKAFLEDWILESPKPPWEA
jgi:transcriptional regulator with XRE-family HTH domain